MVYELTVQSVKLKSTLFTPPSRLINTCEVTCAIGMLYKKAGQPMPEVKAGDNLGKLIEGIPQQVYDAEGGNLSETPPPGRIPHPGSRPPDSLDRRRAGIVLLKILHFPGRG